MLHILSYLLLRLIEKYFHDKKSAPVSMVTMLFESKVVKQDSDSNGNQIWIPEKYSKLFDFRIFLIKGLQLIYSNIVKDESFY